MEEEILSLYKQGMSIYEILQNPKFSYTKIRNALRKYYLLGLSYKEDIRLRRKIEYLLEYSSKSVTDIANMLGIDVFYINLLKHRKEHLLVKVQTLYAEGYSASKIKKMLDLRDKDIKYFFSLIGVYKADYNEVFVLAEQGYSKTSISKYLRISYKKVIALLEYKGAKIAPSNKVSLPYRDAETIKFYRKLGYTVEELSKMTGFSTTQILHDLNK
jgi:transposase